MRKILSALCLLMAIHSTHAQTNIHKRDWLVGGAGTFSKKSITYDDDYTITVRADGGYFFAERLAGGLRLSVVHGTEGNIYIDVPPRVTIYSAVPFLRYYFLKPANKVNVYADASYGWGTVRQKGYQLYKYPISDRTVSVGGAFFLAPSAALELNVGYNQVAYHYPDYTSRETALQVMVGFHVHLKGKK